MPILWQQEVFENASSSKCTFFLANEKMALLKQQLKKWDIHFVCQ